MDRKHTLSITLLTVTTGLVLLNCAAWGHFLREGISLLISLKAHHELTPAAIGIYALMPVIVLTSSVIGPVAYRKRRQNVAAVFAPLAALIVWYLCTAIFIVTRYI
jgi:predicted membrane protein